MFKGIHNLDTYQINQTSHISNCGYLRCFCINLSHIKTRLKLTSLIVIVIENSLLHRGTN